ncbi:MAG: HD-GYP domain-containing protein [Dehalococcoidales bacterium]|nr:HD-GYP domain-containing protein [Dehalococcoidales bacterium]
MGHLRGSARLFVWLVVAAAGAILVFQWQYAEWPAERAAQLVILFLALTGTFADIRGIYLNTNKVVVTLSTGTNFAATILFGPAVAGLMGGIGSVISDVWARRAWYKILFNAANTVLSVTVTSFFYILLNDGTLAPLSSLRNAAAILFASLAYLTANSVFICTVVALAEGYRPWEVWRAAIKGVYVQAISLFPLGTLVVIVYNQTPWGLVLLLFPIVLAQYSFQAYRQLQMQSQRTMETLAQTVDHRDRYTYRHSERVAYYAEKIAQKMKLDISDTETIVSAARIHDLGKVAIDNEILRKAGPLDDDQWRIMKEHPRIGAEIVGQLASYRQIRDLVAYHQERYDGTGYPYGLKGDQLPIGARIITAADAFEAMTSDRPYRKALSIQVAMEELSKGRGGQFDPAVVDAFLAVLEEETAQEKAVLAVDRISKEQVAS